MFPCLLLALLVRFAGILSLLLGPDGQKKSVLTLMFILLEFSLPQNRSLLLWLGKKKAFFFLFFKRFFVRFYLLRVMECLFAYIVPECLVSKEAGRGSCESWCGCWELNPSLLGWVAKPLNCWVISPGSFFHFFWCCTGFILCVTGLLMAQSGRKPLQLDLCNPQAPSYYKHTNWTFCFGQLFDLAKLSIPNSQVRRDCGNVQAQNTMNSLSTRTSNW